MIDRLRAVSPYACPGGAAPGSERSFGQTPGEVIGRRGEGGLRDFRCSDEQLSP